MGSPGLTNRKQSVNLADSAIMKYHSLKMEEVNDTMKHLWNKTYQGTGALWSLVVCLPLTKFSFQKISMGLKLYLTLKEVQPNGPTITELVRRV